MPGPNDPFSAANVEAMRKAGRLKDPFNMPPRKPPSRLQQLSGTIGQVASGVMNSPTGEPLHHMRPPRLAGLERDLLTGGPRPRDLLRQLAARAQAVPGQFQHQREAARIRREPGVEGLSPADIERIVGQSQGPYGPGR